MFESKASPESKPIAVLKKIFIVVIVLLLVIGAVSSHRAFYQVRSLEITGGESISTGSTVAANVVTSG